MARKKKTHDPFRWFDSSPEVIRLERDRFSMERSLS